MQSEGNLGLWILVGGGLLLWLLYFQGGGSAVTSGPTTGTPLDAWAQAIADFESGGNPNALNYRNNNPGNLKYAGQPGATGQDSRGFAIFGSLQDGWDALTRQLQKYVNDHPDFTLLQMMTLYLGGNPYAPVTTGQGNPFTYAQSIADKLGVQVSSTLRQIFG